MMSMRADILRIDGRQFSEMRLSLVNKGSNESLLWMPRECGCGTARRGTESASDDAMMVRKTASAAAY